MAGLGQDLKVIVYLQSRHTNVATRLSFQPQILLLAATDGSQLGPVFNNCQRELMGRERRALSVRCNAMTYNHLSPLTIRPGGMCERLKQAVLKTAIPERV